MNRSLSMCVGAAVVVAAGSAAMADFFPGQPVGIHGTAVGGGNVIPWGDGEVPGEGPHLLGGPQTSFTDPIFGPSYHIDVNSTIQTINLLTMTFDLDPFFVDGYVVSFDVTGLKQDGTIVSVFANYGLVTVHPDGNGFNWTGGPVHANNAFLVLEIVQSPTPGAAAVFGLGGLMAARRRR
jgi:hypothetical protein